MRESKNNKIGEYNRATLVFFLLFVSTGLKFSKLQCLLVPSIIKKAPGIDIPRANKVVAGQNYATFLRLVKIMRSTASIQSIIALVVKPPAEENKKYIVLLCIFVYL